MKKIFSGIQPSGVIHLGNYLGAIKQWVSLQDEVDEAIFCIVDLHAITVPQHPETLRKNILSVAALYIAAGINPEKSSIFVQSMRPEHTELAWILNCITNFGELSRMTQFKDKSAKFSDQNIPVGLFDYPVLMAADILLYQATHVPVGEDQKQHVELTRDLAQRFNKRFGDTFVVPEPVIKESAARVMGLDNPLRKMSKSASSPNNYIAITDSADLIKQKIKRAVTDSGSEIRAGKDKPAITNLLNMYSEVSGKSLSILEKEFQGKSYGELKQGLGEAVVSYLAPVQEKYFQLLKNESNLIKILQEGGERIGKPAGETLKEVKRKTGLGI